MLAVENDNSELTSILLSQNCNIDIVNLFNETALDIAIKQENTEIINLFQSFATYNSLRKLIPIEKFVKTPLFSKLKV